MKNVEHPDDKTPQITSLSEVQPKPIYWLWYHRIALGKLTLIAGDPGLGKSFATLSMAAHVSAGRPWPDMPNQENPPGDVILLSAEDDIEDTILPRLMKMKADCTRIKSLQAVDVDTGHDFYTRLFDLGNDVHVIEDMLKDFPDCKLIVIDPISAYIGTGKDGNSNTDVRSMLTPLAKIANDHDVAVVAVSHLTKGGTANPLYRVMGSLAWGAAPRTVWTVVKDGEGENGNPKRRLFLPAKNNLAEAEGTGLAFTINDGCVVWEPTPIETTAAEHFQRQYELSNKRGPQPKARKEAERWLKEALASTPQWATEIKERAKQEGISWKTVINAKRALRITSEQFRKNDLSRWYWRTSDQPQAPPQDTTPPPTPYTGDTGVSVQAQEVGR